jgi:hypothetical protein
MPLFKATVKQPSATSNNLYFYGTCFDIQAHAQKGSKSQADQGD